MNSQSACGPRVDEDSLAQPESRVRRVIPTMMYSRVLMAKATAP